MSALAKGFTKLGRPLKSESILKCLPRMSEAVLFEKCYKDYVLMTPKIQNNHELFIFPKFEFKTFSKIAIDNLIKFLYNTIKARESLGIECYNTILKTNIIYDIDVDIISLLNEMRINKVRPNQVTYQLLIELYSKGGDILSAKSVVNEMRKKGYNLNEILKSQVYGGFIRAGKYDEAQNFLEEENLSENTFAILRSKALAYADTGRFNDVLDSIKIIKENNDKSVKSCINEVYCHCVKSGTPDNVLEQLITIGKVSENFFAFTELIFDLNRFGYYSNSLQLLLKYRNIKFSFYIMTDIFISFNRLDCPRTVLETFLKSFSININANYPHLFVHMDYDSAFDLSRRIINHNNCRLLVSNLLRMAFTMKSTEKAEEILKFYESNLDLSETCSMFQLILLPILLETGFVKDVTEAVYLLPTFKDSILQAIAMDLLVKGDFAGFRCLVGKYSIKPADYYNYSNDNPIKMKETISNDQLEMLLAESSKVFNNKFSQWLINSIVIERIIKFTNTNDKEKIVETITLAKKLEMSFNISSITLAARRSPNSYEFLKELIDFKKVCLP